MIPIYLKLTVRKHTFKQHEGFNLGRYSHFLGWTSLVWLTYSTLILLLPTERDPVDGFTWSNFNYTPVIFLLILVGTLGFWNLPAPYGAKHFFKGPKICGLPEEKILKESEGNTGETYRLKGGYSDE